jgi:hypothetical protein
MKHLLGGSSPSDEDRESSLSRRRELWWNIEHTVNSRIIPFDMGGESVKRIQVVPENGANLYGAMIAKEIELARRNAGTLHRSGPKLKDRAKWVHSKYPGWINLARESRRGGLFRNKIKEAR